jgi:outer membrane lipoprotein-sorting protein
MKIIISFGILLSVLCAGSVGQAQASSLAPSDILDRVDDLFRGESSRGTMSMTVTTAHWTRKLSLEFWSKGKDKSLIRILSPKKERGTATLRFGNEIWNYLPKIKRVIKLPSSMMSASWMGSHFNNDDLVKESRIAEDYNFEITFEGERAGQDIVEITCVPKPEAAVVWGKVVVVVRRKDFLPLFIQYYDEDLNLARNMVFSDFRPLGGRNLPARVRMIPSDHPDEFTLVEYEQIEFNIHLKDDLFSLRNLQR